MNTNADRPAGARVAIGSNPERNRTHNRRVVLEVVRLHGPSGRTEIARHAQLTTQAVANIVDELVAENLLIETGRRRAGRGQPPLQFAVNPDGPMTAGVEVAADHLTTVLLDLGGRVRAEASTPADRAEPHIMAPRIASQIAALHRQVGAAARLLGVGIVMPGPFGIDGMSSVGPTTLPGWAGVDAATLLGAAIGTSVIIENDATAAAVGERLHGAGRSLRNFCFIYFGVGLGLGIISEGRPLRGAFGNAGELGHIPVAPRGRQTEAVALERVASLHALRQRLAAVGLHPASLEDLERLHAAGEPTLAAWIAEAADHLAPTVALLENLFDPETIIFGGGLPDAVIDALVAALEPLPVSVATRELRAQPRVMRGQTGQLTAALGAAALPLFETVTPRLNLGVRREPGAGAEPT